VVETTLENVAGHTASTLQVILEDDQAARAYAHNAVRELAA